MSGLGLGIRYSQIGTVAGRGSLSFKASETIVLNCTLPSGKLRLGEEGVEQRPHPLFSSLCFPIPKSSVTLPPLAAPSTLVSRGRQSIISSEGRVEVLAWELHGLLRLPVFTPSLGQLQLVWGLAGHRRLWAEGLSKDISCTLDGPVLTCPTPQSLLPGLDTWHTRGACRWLDGPGALRVPVGTRRDRWAFSQSWSRNQGRWI